MKRDEPNQKLLETLFILGCHASTRKENALVIYLTVDVCLRRFMFPFLTEMLRRNFENFKNNSDYNFIMAVIT